MYHKLFRDALHPWKRCIAKGCIAVYWRACRWYDWIGFNSAKLLSSTTNISVARVDSSPPKLMHKIFWDALCIHVLRTWLGWIVPSCVSRLQPHLPNATITSSECSNTREFYPHIPLQTWIRESLRVQNVVTFSQHQCKITWRKLCFHGLHQWLPIITIATLGSFGAMLQQTNNLNETF